MIPGKRVFAQSSFRKWFSTRAERSLLCCWPFVFRTVAVRVTPPVTLRRSQPDTPPSPPEIAPQPPVHHAIPGTLLQRVTASTNGYRIAGRKAGHLLALTAKCAALVKMCLPRAYDHLALSHTYRYIAIATSSQTRPWCLHHVHLESCDRSLGFKRDLARPWCTQDTCIHARIMGLPRVTRVARAADEQTPCA
jgi:hypothetical protein